MRARVAIWLGLVGGLLLACSSGGGSGSASGDLGERYCALFAPCCTDPIFSGEQQGCKLLFSASASRNPGAAEACISQYEAYAQQADWCANFANLAKYPRPASCDVAYPQGTGGGGGQEGTKRPGEACDSSGDCAPSAKGGVACYHDFDTDEDFCQLRVPVAAGQSCAATVDGDVTYLGDVPEGATEINICDHEQGVNCEGGVCVALSALGEPCADYMSCASEDHFCSGTCQARLPPGSDCSSSTRACDEQGYCDINRVCIPVKPDGTTCQTHKECSSGYCDEDSVCGVFNPNPSALSLLLFCN